MSCAVVVGLCQHGLAIVRALARSGVSVVALEQNDTLPGYYTRRAKVLPRPLDEEQLVTSLVDLAQSSPDARPALFLTSDTMTRAIASQIDRVRQHYLIPWVDVIQKLQDKSKLQEYCDALSISYPNAVVYGGHTDRQKVESLSTRQLIVKPVQPLGQFKTRMLDGLGDLASLADTFPESLPFLVQEWIPGDDRSLYFCAVYLIDGEAHCSFIGRKVASHPPAQGQTTAAVSAVHEKLETLTERFFSGTGYTGPASVEYKIDEQGQPWVIEPTIGRTDFWLNLAIHSGANFPVIQYHQLFDLPLGPQFCATDSRPFSWHDSERDPAGTLKRILLGDVPRFGKHVFSYLSLSDPLPAIKQTVVLGARLFNR